MAGEGGKNGRLKDLPGRSFRFAARVIKVVRALPRDRAADVIARQLARSGTSVGANIEEAQGSHSKAQFIQQMNTARSEARETNYWLRLIAEVGLLKRDRLQELIDESEELIRILVTIVKRARNA